MSSNNQDDNTDPTNSPRDPSDRDPSLSDNSLHPDVPIEGSFSDDLLSDDLLSDDLLSDDLLSDEALADLQTLLSDPLTWDEPDASIEDFLVAAIAEEAQHEMSQTPGVSHNQASRDVQSGNKIKAGDKPVSGQVHSTSEIDASGNESNISVASQPAEADVVSIFSRSRLVTATVPFVAGIAAALLLVFGLGALGNTEPGPDQIELALTGTALAPEASAQALILEGSLGVRIRLDVSGLAPSPEGTYYEAWVRKSPEVGVSAGTFHLRGGDGEIELWTGVSTTEYPLITVTLQQEGAGPMSSGQVVLKGRLEQG